MIFYLDPPEIRVERVWVHSGEGNEALLVCIVNAEPLAEVIIICTGFRRR